MFNKNYNNLEKQIKKLNDEVFPITYFDSIDYKYKRSHTTLVHKNELNTIEAQLIDLRQENEKLRALLNEVIDYVYKDNK